MVLKHFKQIKHSFGLLQNYNKLFFFFFESFNLIGQTTQEYFWSSFQNNHSKFCHNQQREKEAPFNTFSAIHKKDENVLQFTKTTSYIKRSPNKFFLYIYIYYFFVLFITFTKNIARIISSKLEKCMHQSKNKMVFLVRDINSTQKENGIKKK